MPGAKADATRDVELLPAPERTRRETIRAGYLMACKLERGKDQYKEEGGTGSDDDARDEKIWWCQHTYELVLYVVRSRQHGRRPDDYAARSLLCFDFD